MENLYSATCYYDDILALKVLCIVLVLFLSLCVGQLAKPHSGQHTRRYRSLGYTVMKHFRFTGLENLKSKVK